MSYLDYLQTTNDKQQNCSFYCFSDQTQYETLNQSREDTSTYGKVKPKGKTNRYKVIQLVSKFGN